MQQLISDIASYYGYNDFLAEKLFQLFPVAEVVQSILVNARKLNFCVRQSSSSRPMRFPAR